MLLVLDNFQSIMDTTTTEAFTTMIVADIFVKQYAQLNLGMYLDRRPSLLQGLAQFRRYHAIDPRDHVYAVLNLVSHKGLGPDYTKSVTEIYIGVVKFIIEADQTLDFLNACKPKRY
jgi:hypothetical protein